MKQNLGCLDFVCNQAVHALNGQAVWGQRSFNSTWRCSECNSIAFWEIKVTFLLLSAHFQGIFASSRVRWVIDFYKFHWHYFVKREVITLPFFALPCSFVTEAVLCCICLVRWSWELNSDDDIMEQFLLYAIRFTLRRNWVKMVSCSRASNVAGGVHT